MTTRISTAQMFSNAQNHISKAREKESISNTKAATQKEINRPSESPAEWTVAANLKDDLTIRDSIAKNAKFANSFLTASENTLAQLQELVGRTHQLAIEASGSATVSPDQFYHILPEVEGLFQNVIQTVNTEFAHRPIFGGYQSQQKAFDVEGNFLGDNGKIEVEIDRNLKIPVNLSASQVLMGEGMQRGVNVIETYRNLIQGLKEQNLEQVQGSIEGLLGAIDQFSLGRTQIAGSMTEIQRALDSYEVTQEQTQKVVSEIEEADPVKVFSDLVRDQTVLRAAIETNRKVLNESPIDTLLK